MAKFTFSSIILWLLFMGQGVYSQSLYHDAWRLIKLVENNSSPVLEFSNSDSINYRIGSGERKNVDSIMVLDEIGIYHFHRTGGAALDTAFLTYQNVTDTITFVQGFDLDNMPNQLSWNIFLALNEISGTGGFTVSTTDINPEWRITKNIAGVPPPSGQGPKNYTSPGDYRINLPDTINVQYGAFDSTFILPNEDFNLNIYLKNNSCAFQIQSDFQANKRDKEDYYELITLLALHTDYKSDEFSDASLDSIYATFRNNSYLQPLLDNWLYSYDLNAVRVYMDFDANKVSDSLAAKVKRNYEWENVLYRNAEIDPKKIALDNGEDYYQNLNVEQAKSQNQLLLAAENSNANYRSITGFDTQSIIIGLSDFIAERAQEELNIAFMQKFEKFMAKYPEMKTLFPQTLNSFLQFNIYNYKKLLQNARPSFHADLESLGQNIPKILKLDKYKGLIDHSAEVYNLALFYEISQLVYQEKPLETVMLTTYKSLARRQQDLIEVINFQLADSLGMGNPKIINLKNEVNAYSALLKDVSTNLDDLKKEIRDTMNQLRGRVRQVDDSALTGNTNLLQGQYDLIKNVNQLPNYFFRFPDGNSVPAPDYIENYVENYLSGTNYYGNYFNEIDPSISEYNEVFSERPKGKFYVAKGLELTRVLVKDDYSPGMQKTLFDINQLNSEVTEVQKEYILKKRHSPDNRLAEELKWRRLISNGIQFELSRLGRAGFSKETDVDAAALQYLNELLDTSIREPWSGLAFLAEDISFGSDFETALVNQGFSKHEFEQMMAKADQSLLTVYQSVLSRLDTIEKYKLEVPTEENTFFNNYLSDRAAFYTVSDDEITGLQDFENKFSTTQKQISRLNPSLQKIDSLLLGLENTYISSPLIKARKNAGQLKTAVEYAIHLLYSIKDKKSQNQLIYQDTSHVQFQVTNKNQNGLDSTKIFSQQEITTKLQKLNGEKIKWITRSQYDSLITVTYDNTAIGQDAFLGLLYTRLNNISDLPKISSNGLPAVTTKLFDAVFDLESERLTFDKKKASGEKLDFKDYFPFLKTAIGAINTAVQTPVFYGRSLAEVNTTLAILPAITEEGLSLYDNISAKEYGYAINNAMEIYSTIMDAVITKKKADKKDVKSAEKIKNKALVYGTFMADMVDARSPDEVKSALAAAAVPPGTSRLKRDLGGNLALNAYMGVGFNREWLFDVPQSAGLGKDTVGTTASFSVPVGISMSSKLWTNMKGSVTLFVPVLDLGAVTSLRFDDVESIEKLPELDFNNLIAPGVFMYYNWPDAPISLGMGYQFGPRLRKIELADGTTENYRSRRFTFLNIVVDIPLFNFVNGNPVYRNTNPKVVGN